MTACRNIVRSAAIHAYSQARFRDDKRSVTLLPVPQGSVTNAEVAARTTTARDGIAAGGK